MKRLLQGLLGWLALGGAVSHAAEPLPATTILIDVRSAGEYASGHLQGARLLPLDELAHRIARAVPDKATPVALYCRSGRRSAQAHALLQQLGYRHLSDLGGLDAARRHTGLPVVQ